MSEDVEVELELVSETAKAYLVVNPNNNQVRIPKSQVEEEDRFNEHDVILVKLTVPQWIVDEKELEE